MLLKQGDPAAVLLWAQYGMPATHMRLGLHFAQVSACLIEIPAFLHV